MFDSSFPTIIAASLSALFCLGAIVHLAAPTFIQRANKQWDLPPKFHRVTGLAKLVAAVFLAIPQTRIWGVIVAGILTIMAEIILLENRQYMMSVVGLVFITVLYVALLSSPL